MAVIDDRTHLDVDHTRGGLAVGWRSAEPTVGKIGILVRRKLHHPELLTHPPACDHVSRKEGRLLDITLRTGGSSAIDDFLGRTTSQHPDDAGTKISFRVVVTITVRPLIGHAK